MSHENLIEKIRHRILKGQSKKEIADDLGKDFDQEIIFLCYMAAQNLIDGEKKTEYYAKMSRNK